MNPLKKAHSSMIFFMLAHSWWCLAAGPKLAIHIAQIVAHPSLDEVQRGIVEELNSSEFADKIQLYFHNANGDLKIAAQIASKIISTKPTVMVGISTPMSQALVAKKHNIPLVFSVVNDPLAAKLVTSLTHPGGTVTGLRMVTPKSETIEFIRKTLPKSKTIGLIYNSGESNSVSEVMELSRLMKERHLTPILKSVTNTSGVQNATAQLLGSKVDAILLPTDNTVVSALGSILQSALKKKVPVFASDPNSVKEGALAALGHDHVKLGRITAKLVLRILRGEKPGDIPVVEPKDFELYINKKTEGLLGLKAG